MGPVIPFSPEHPGNRANNWKHKGEGSDDSGIKSLTSSERKTQLPKPEHKEGHTHLHNSNSYPSHVPSSSTRNMDETDGPSNSSKKFNEKPEPAQRSIFDLSPEKIGAFANAGLTHDIARLKAIKEMEGPVNLGSFTVIQSGGRLKEIFDNNDGTSRGKNIAGVTIFKENVDHTIEMRGAKSNK